MVCSPSDLYSWYQVVWAYLTEKKKKNSLVGLPVSPPSPDVTFILLKAWSILVRNSCASLAMKQAGSRCSEKGKDYSYQGKCSAVVRNSFFFFVCYILLTSFSAQNLAKLHNARENSPTPQFSHLHCYIIWLLAWAKTYWFLCKTMVTVWKLILASTKSGTSSCSHPVSENKDFV